MSSSDRLGELLTKPVGSLRAPEAGRLKEAGQGVGAEDQVPAAPGHLLATWGSRKPALPETEGLSVGERLWP